MAHHQNERLVRFPPSALCPQHTAPSTLWPQPCGSTLCRPRLPEDQADVAAPELHSHKLFGQLRLAPCYPMAWQVQLLGGRRHGSPCRWSFCSTANSLGNEHLSWEPFERMFAAP